MLHYLTKISWGQYPRIELTQPEAAAIIAAWRSMGTVATIEEEWNNLVQNYVDLEMEMLRSALEMMVVDRGSYHEFQDERLDFSRRLTNLLATARAYLDHAPHHLGKLDGITLAAPFKALTSVAYDNAFAYRFMEALRNYAQHRDLPLHGVTYDTRWTGDVTDGESDKGLARHSVAATISLKKIRADRKFPPKVKAELEGKSETLDVLTLTREYIEELGKVHLGLRTLLKAPIENWKRTIRDAIARYAAQSQDVIGLAVAELDARGNPVERQAIFEDLLVRVDRLVRRNGNLINLRKRYVSNEVPVRP